MEYVVPQGGELIPLTVIATMDGSAAAATFYAAVQLVAPSGRVMATAITTGIAAGASATCTWFPRVGSAGTGSGLTSISVQDNGVLIGSEPILDFIDGAVTWQIVDNGANTRIEITPLAGGSIGNTQSFACTAGTWNKPTGVQFVTVVCIGGGGGAGGGYSGNPGPVSGGAGGGGGAVTVGTFNAADLGATVAVTAGCGGTGGAAGAGGVAGGDGTGSSFGAFLFAGGGGGGRGGVSAGGAAGSAGGSVGGSASGNSGVDPKVNNANATGSACCSAITTGNDGWCSEWGGASAPFGINGSNGLKGGSSVYAGPGGGSGGGHNASPDGANGGQGGKPSSYTPGGGGSAGAGSAGGSGTAGGNGAAGPSPYCGQGGGGAGGGTINGAAGGNGGRGAGGGGGGSGGTLGGKGGDGGTGYVLVVST